MNLYGFCRKKLDTLIDESFLAKYKNVFVIKSIGKSFGTGAKIGYSCFREFSSFKKN